MPFKSLPLKECLYSSVVLNIICVIATFVSMGNLPPVVPLFYGLPVGHSQLIPSWGLLIAPAAAFILTVLNTVLGSHLKDVFLIKILMVASLFVSLLSIITVTRIILLVSL